MFPAVVLQGRLVRLRPVTETDLLCFLRWLNDPDINQWLAMPESGPPATLEAEHAWYERTKEDPNQLVWSMETQGAICWGTWPSIVGSGWTPPSLASSLARRGSGAKGTGPTRYGRRSVMPSAQWASGASTSIPMWRTRTRTAALRSAGSGRKGA
jgi:hypothetical protein